MRDEVTALQDHIQACFASHPEAQDLYLKITTETMDLWEAYVPIFSAFNRKLLAKVCEGGKCSKTLNKSCCGVATGAFRVMLNEVCKVRVHAISAHHLPGPKEMGIILHTTLQELWVLK